MLILHGAHFWQLTGFMLFLCLTFSHLLSAAWNDLKNPNKQTNWDCCLNALQHIWWNHNVCMSFNNIFIFFDLHWPDPAGSSQAEMPRSPYWPPAPPVLLKWYWGIFKLARSYNLFPDHVAADTVPILQSFPLLSVPWDASACSFLAENHSLRLGDYGATSHFSHFTLRCIVQEYMTT